MTLSVVAGTAHRSLANAVAAQLSVEVSVCETDRFPDGELRPVVAGVRGADVFVVQPTGPPVNDHLVELLLLLDACRRAGADRVTAVVPYFGYGRQDRRLAEGQALGIRVCADALAAAGADRLLVIDPHSTALEAACAMPVEMLTAVPVLASALSERIADRSVVVAPDLGAVKLAERYAATFGSDVAIVRKARLSGEAVHARDLAGEVAGRSCVIVDDMISTGATVEAAVRLVRARGAREDVTVVAIHGILVAGAMARMASVGVRHLVLADTVDQARMTLEASGGPDVEVYTVAPLLAQTIGRLHRNEALDGSSPSDI